jgi:prepilin-type N-terminal cleavage/methylation domain-containing protein
MRCRDIRRRCRGFTVIELAAVIALTAIVGAMGYSAYRTHVVRTQVAEGLSAAAATQNDVLQAFRRLGEAPAGPSDLATHPADTSPFVESIGVENGRIDLIYGAAADRALTGRRLSLTPYETATLDVVWLCGNRIPMPGLFPLGFANGGRQVEQLATTVETRFLPSACR